MPTIDIEIVCLCGVVLRGELEGFKNRLEMVVDPCEKCIEEAREEGYDNGYDERDKEVE